jgi:hypothetical protein
MVKVESAVVDPQVAKDAESCIKVCSLYRLAAVAHLFLSEQAAQQKLLALEPVVGCRFNTTPTKEGFIEMIHCGKLDDTLVQSSSFCSDGSVHGRAAFTAGLRDGDFVSKVHTALWKRASVNVDSYVVSARSGQWAGHKHA